ncbi:MAG: hypothetical protein HY958_12200 [Bacteroidia bacterium]|nr:hypothetical protein [Bacteroidia bacterium]
MDKKQEDFISMALATQKTLLNAQSVWASDTVMANNVSILGNLITQVNTQAQIQINATGGISTNKKEARLALADWTLTVSAALQGYASDNQNNEIYEKAHITKTELKTIRDTLVSDIAKNISDLAVANLTALAPYGITTAIITTGSTLKSSYDALIPAPKVARSSKKTATEIIAALIARLRNHLDAKLDKNIVRYKTNRLFNDYHNARRIDTTGVRHKKDTTAPPS